MASDEITGNVNSPRVDSIVSSITSSSGPSSLVPQIAHVGQRLFVLSLDGFLGKCVCIWYSLVIVVMVGIFPMGVIVIVGCILPPPPRSFGRLIRVNLLRLGASLGANKVVVLMEPRVVWWKDGLLDLRVRCKLSPMSTTPRKSSSRSSTMLGPRYGITSIDGKGAPSIDSPSSPRQLPLAKKTTTLQ
ncbi:hypothetical protein F2Q68_00005443 [Brassica cretica]|uniref:Uncharacterized protein n=1 Tax=Brassica cretica TaxID=69181 RepID=A0A8S9JML5_BRACR|nr:hypothetical protein F2Q68_00005443 [Brassica cretica]